ncbi:ribosome maturation factor RimP [Zeaxanthinibacter enoshimensis]|uniref:Ribosome maturation factor RimP n=2 Tax=Zeaxanthinibacter enoshimensis TaxID=392009 RepID=A0A4R6TMN2_9FLAO|nr:ribosome maturation factor RimP [Zeaxanthinibacter enoshimensis]
MSPGKPGGFTGTARFTGQFLPGVRIEDYRTMLKEKVTTLLDKVLEENPSIFLIDLYVGTDNQIRIILDGDEGINLEDCMKVSRAIEFSLDREEQDFALEVTSAGATAPLVNARQYPKNIGRKLQVKTAGESFEGTLTEVTDKAITLEWKAREPKPVGKGKVTVEKKQEVPFSDIEEAKVKLIF